MRTPTAGGEQMPGEPGTRSPPSPPRGPGDESQRVRPQLSLSAQHAPAVAGVNVARPRPHGLRALHVDPDSSPARAPNQGAPIPTAPAPGRKRPRLRRDGLDNNRSFTDADPGWSGRP